MCFDNEMSVDISLSPAESDSAPSTTSSFGSMSESGLPRDKMEQLVRKLRSENKQLQLRVLGVNELARLLQDRSEKVKVLEDKNKRLEVAVVRLENRCANLEQKLRADGGGGPVSGLKSMQPPSIPGPSRQILEALMKENSELKKALNAMQKKGPSGYLEAVVSEGREGGREGGPKAKVDISKTGHCFHFTSSSSITHEIWSKSWLSGRGGRRKGVISGKGEKYIC